MELISDEEFMQMRQRGRTYVGLLLMGGPNYDRPDARAIVYEHGKRNLSLMKAGKFPIICPVTDGGPLKGIGVFCVNEEEVRAIMDEDPGVKAGVFTYELHPVRSFPGSALPEKKD
jgi:hypothetical protein